MIFTQSPNKVTKLPYHWMSLSSLAFNVFGTTHVDGLQCLVQRGTALVI